MNRMKMSRTDYTQPYLFHTIQAAQIERMSIVVFFFFSLLYAYVLEYMVRTRLVATIELKYTKSDQQKHPKSASKRALEEVSNGFRNTHYRLTGRRMQKYKIFLK